METLAVLAALSTANKIGRAVSLIVGIPIAYFAIAAIIAGVGMEIEKFKKYHQLGEYAPKKQEEKEKDEK